jgi:hypothetical protein
LNRAANLFGTLSAVLARIPSLTNLSRIQRHAKVGGGLHGGNNAATVTFVGIATNAGTIGGIIPAIVNAVINSINSGKLT